MNRFKLDYDEGLWSLSSDCDDTVILRFRDDEAFELLDALKPVAERRAEIEDHKAIYKGLRQAGYFEEALRPGWDFCGD